MAVNEFGEMLDANGYAQSVFSEGQCFFAKYGTPCSGDLIRHEVYHHDMGGKTRSLSKRYGAWVTLCVAHHQAIHSGKMREEEIWLKMLTQGMVMSRYNWDADTFRSRFGKNYI